MSKLPKLIALLGPTASGKSGLALEIARDFNGEVISADSRTIFTGMTIGTAKPAGSKSPAAEVKSEDVEEEGIHAAKSLGIKQLFHEKPYVVEGVPHWGIDIVDPDETFTAAQFKEYAEKKIADIVKRGKTPILAGGTGLYISAVVDNLLFTDAGNDEKLRAELDALTQPELEARLKDVDEKAYETLDLANRRRVLRAIEIIETTGKPLAEQQRKGPQKYDSLLIGLDVERETLYERIETRVDEMVVQGLVDEVRVLKDKYGCEVNAMTGIGYRQICAFLDGYMKLRDAIEVLKRDTRHYAKRQLTWFKRDERIRWVRNGGEAKELVLSHLERTK